MVRLGETVFGFLGGGGGEECRLYFWLWCSRLGCSELWCLCFALAEQCGFSKMQCILSGVGVHAAWPSFTC